MTHARVVTVSDRCFSGAAQDRSGPLAVELLTAGGVVCDPIVLVPDDAAQIADAVRAGIADGCDLVLTTGGTGIAPRDVTPEAVHPLLERPLPGIVEAIRTASREAVPTSVLSRGVAGASRRTLIVTLPGSTGGVRDGLAVVIPLLDHIASQLRGGDHEVSPVGETDRP